MPRLHKGLAMSGLHSLVRYLERDGGVPSEKDFEKAGLLLTEDGGSVVGDSMWKMHGIPSGSALHEDFKIVGMVLGDHGKKKGRFLVYSGPDCITEKIIHTYKSTP